MITFYTEYCGIKEQFNPGYVRNWIKKQIRMDVTLSEDKKQVLLEYPVVYVHVWEKNPKKYSVYVGETYNLTQRLGEHLQSDEKWHIEWQQKISEGKAFSWFFSSLDMNESMCLDLENSLVRLLENQEINVVTEVTSKQGAYSNKNERNKLLKEIWDTLSVALKFDDFNVIDKSCLSTTNLKCSNNNLFFTYIQPNSKDNVLSYLQEVCKDNKLFLEYPMVYLYVWLEEGKLKTYVGETDDFYERIKQHLEEKEKWEKNWVTSIIKDKAYLLAFVHPSFNKSMIRDIENRIILYTKYLQFSQNSRHNERGKYSNQCEMFTIFQLIIKNVVAWEKEVLNSGLFLTLEDVQNNAIGLASPFYELTDDQERIKNKILDEVDRSLNTQEQRKELIVLYGGAGTGKTMLLSSLLFALYNEEECKCDLIVNNEELAPTYHNMLEIWKLGKSEGTLYSPIVYYATDYFKKEKCRDVLLIDEGHLLNTQDHTGKAKEQLSKIVSKSKCTILVFDPFQFIDKNKYWKGNYGFSDCESTKKSFESLFNDDTLKIIVLDLDKQLRMRCADKTFDWISSICIRSSELNELQGFLVNNSEGKKILKDSKDYYIGVYKNISEFYNDLCSVRRQDKDTLCLATYDFEYDTSKYWYRIGNNKVFHWHFTGDGKKVKNEAGELSALSWYKKSKDDEVGSVHDIQGFDLNYAFIIIGPSIQYNPRRGKDKHIEKGIQVNSKNHRTNHNVDFILNELRVILTRGVKGIMIYAVDENLRNQLYKSLNNERV